MNKEFLLFLKKLEIEKNNTKNKKYRDLYYVPSPSII